MNVGSLFTGVGGLDLAVERHFGADLAWMCEYDPHCRTILEQRFPGVPIYNDVRQLGADTPPVDILVGGYPCQPFSVAGLRKGEDDPRHLWPHFARLIRLLRPRVVVAENVAGHLRLGFHTVLADLAELGMDVRWGVVRASDVGAPHQRARLFVVATDARHGESSDEVSVGRDAASVGPGDALTDAERGGRNGRSSQPRRGAEPRTAAQGPGEGAAADAVVGGVDSDGRVRRGDAGVGDPAGRAALPAGAEVARPEDAVEDRAGAATDAGSERHDGRRGRDPEATSGDGVDGRAGAQGHRASAADTDAGRREHRGAVAVPAEQPAAQRGRDEAHADADGGGRGARPERGRSPEGAIASRGDESAADTVGTAERGPHVEAPTYPDLFGSQRDAIDACEGEPHGSGCRRGNKSEGQGKAPAARESTAWGVYEPAVRQWESVLGRRAPSPTDDRGRLMPEFVEWMMGLPAGWTEGQSRTARLRMLGNAVVPQQAALALSLLAPSLHAEASLVA